MPSRGQGVTLPAASQTSSDLVLPYELPELGGSAGGQWACYLFAEAGGDGDRPLPAA